MPKLPIIGSVAAIGGATGIGGLAWESSKPPRNHISLTSKTRKPLTLKRCTIYSILKSDNKTVKKEEESAFREKVTNPTSWERINKECGVKDKIYVANRSGWAYHDSDQNLQWNVVDSASST
nr:hypothetical protein [Mycoplasma haemofelis]